MEGSWQANGVPVREQDTSSSYFGNARPKISNFTAQYLCLHLYIQSQHCTRLDLSFRSCITLDIGNTANAIKRSTNTDEWQWGNIYLINLHSCCVGVCGEIWFLQIEGPIVTGKVLESAFRFSSLISHKVSLIHIIRIRISITPSCTTMIIQDSEEFYSYGK